MYGREIGRDYRRRKAEDDERQRPVLATIWSSLFLAQPFMGARALALGVAAYFEVNGPVSLSPELTAQFAFLSGGERFNWHGHAL